MLYYISYINNYSKWIPRPQKPGYSHQNQNCMASIGWDMVKIGWNGSHFEKHGCHVSHITYLYQTNNCSNLFSGPENLCIAPKHVILWTFWVEIGLYQELVGLAAIKQNKMAAMCALLHFYVYIIVLLDSSTLKPGYSHQNHNSMSFVGWDMVKIGVHGGHFEKWPLQNSAHTFARGIPAKYFI